MENKPGQETTSAEPMTPKALAARMGITAKDLRKMLRREYPRQGKSKKWEISAEVAKELIKSNKAEAKAKTPADSKVKKAAKKDKGVLPEKEKTIGAKETTEKE